MSFKIKIVGNASQQEIKEAKLSQQNAHLTMLTVLRNLAIPIASSCDGEGACKKCVINGDIISCQIALEDFVQDHGDTVQVDYL